jgi:hypothetical protein
MVCSAHPGCPVQQNSSSLTQTPPANTLLQALRAVTTPHADLSARISLLEGPQAGTAESGQVTPPLPPPPPPQQQQQQQDEAANTARSQAASRARRVDFGQDDDAADAGNEGFAAPDREAAKFDFGGTPVDSNQAGDLIDDDTLSDLRTHGYPQQGPQDGRQRWVHATGDCCRLQATNACTGRCDVRAAACLNVIVGCITGYDQVGCCQQQHRDCCRYTDDQYGSEPLRSAPLTQLPSMAPNLFEHTQPQAEDYVDWGGAPGNIGASSDGGQPSRAAVPDTQRGLRFSSDTSPAAPTTPQLAPQSPGPNRYTSASQPTQQLEPAGSLSGMQASDSQLQAALGRASTAGPRATTTSLQYANVAASASSRYQGAYSPQALAPRPGSPDRREVSIQHNIPGRASSQVAPVAAGSGVARAGSLASASSMEFARSIQALQGQTTSSVAQLAQVGTQRGSEYARQVCRQLCMITYAVGSCTCMACAHDRAFNFCDRRASLQSWAAGTIGCSCDAEHTGQAVCSAPGIKWQHARARTRQNLVRPL